MDLSEEWRIAIKGLEYVVAFGMVGGGFYLAYRLRRRWMRFLIFGSSTFVAVVVGLALWFDLSFVEGSRMRGPILLSPDGRHVAVVYWVMSGAVGTDQVHVSVRTRHDPFATEVFAGMAQSPPNDPDIRWTDDHHLLISYWKQGKVTECQPEGFTNDGVAVMCQE